MHAFGDRFACKIFYHSKSTEWDILNGDCVIRNKITSMSCLPVLTAVIDPVSFMVCGGVPKESNADCRRSGIY